MTSSAADAAKQQEREKAIAVIAASLGQFPYLERDRLARAASIYAAQQRSRGGE